jgi:hypothetical protein
MLILIAVAVLLIFGIVMLVVIHKRVGNFASLTVYHDFQTKDKQEAVEVVMEKKAGKKLEAQESGKDNDLHRGADESPSTVH